MDTTKITKTRNTRSRSGCLTCRHRKKKCDELLFPVCQNCLGKNLECRWSRQIVDLHNKLKQVKYVGKGKSPPLIPIDPPTETESDKQSVSAPSSLPKRTTGITGIPDPFSFASTPATSSALTPAIASLDEDIMTAYSDIGYPWDDIDSSRLSLEESSLVPNNFSSSLVGDSKRHISPSSSGAFLRHTQIQIVKPQYESTRRKPSSTSSRIIDKIAYQEDVTSEGNMH